MVMHNDDDGDDDDDLDVWMCGCIDNGPWKMEHDGCWCILLMMMVTMMVMMSIIVIFLFAAIFDNQGNGPVHCDKASLQQDADRRWRLSRPPGEGRAESSRM